MSLNANWMLPEGVEELLPNEAVALEMLRRKTIDDLMSQGYELVMPPVIEFVDSLLTGTATELDTQTYKFMDQHTQRMLGIRADMTPQIARIDAHYLADRDVNRLCYAGTVLRTRPEQMGGQREVLQLGAEIFGIADVSADIETIEAMLRTITRATTQPLTVSIGHVGFYSALVASQNLSHSLEAQVFDAFQRRSQPDIKALQGTINAEAFLTLMQLQGSTDVLSKVLSWSERWSVAEETVMDALGQLKQLVAHFQKEHISVQVHIDLGDVMGYRYHTGLKYSAYVQGRGRALARGGRYDRVGEHFGRARPATGFSADLKALFRLS